MTALAEDGPGIGYPSVADALTALSVDPSVQFGEESGWVVADAMEGDDIVLWTFTAPEHEAHPSAVKRTISPTEDGWQMEMKVLCEADAEVCDELVREFERLNSSMQRSVQWLKPTESDENDSPSNAPTHDGVPRE